MPRFVILRHEFPAGASRASHWDLMFDTGTALRTWAIESPPDIEAACEAGPMADHRREYLDYEGPVSGDRGSVVRWDSGDYELVRGDESEDDATEFAVRVVGAKLRGTIRLSASPPCRYRYTAEGTGRG